MRYANNNRIFKRPQENTNPYDFIPLKKVIRSQYTKGTLSGYIEASITPKSRLIIPGNNINGKYELFKIGSQYAIPGSEVKGIVRNVFETITNSCLSSVNNDLHLDNIYANECLVEFEKGKLKGVYNSIQIDCTSDNKLIDLRRNKHYEDYIEYKTNLTYNHKKQMYYSQDNNHKIVFSKSDGIQYCNFVGKFIKINCQQPEELQKFFEKSINLDEQNLNLYNLLKEKNHFWIPAYYTKRDKKIYLSISREELKYSLNDLIGDSLKCTADNALCPACSLFGYISNESSLSSRVRFTDFLAPINSKVKKDYTELVTLNPHPENGKNYIINQFDDNPGLAGRKYYLNFKSYNGKVAKNNDNVVGYFEYISDESNVIFNGKIYFENLTKEELDKLIFSIELGNDSNHFQKIGHGKPYEYGSCLVQCTNLYLNNDDFTDLLANPVKNCVINHPNYFAENKDLDKITRLFNGKVGYSNKFLLK